MEEVQLEIRGMTCDGCARDIVKALDAVPGVLSAEIPSWDDGRATVRFSDLSSRDDVVGAVEAAGYTVKGWEIVEQSNGAERSTPTDLDNPYDSGADNNVDAYDLVVVGGGSAAFSAAIKTSELGGRALIVNKGLPIGGTCVNVGCVPSKTLIRAAETRHRAEEHRFAGIETSGRVTDFSAITTQAQSLIADLRQQKYVDVVADDPNVQILEGRGKIVGPRAVEVDGRLIEARNILVATGARTFVPDIPGLSAVGYLTNETAYTLSEQPEHLIVLGGRYVALENAQLFARLGSTVTVLQRSARIIPDESADLSDALTGYLSDEGIDIRTGVTLESVREHDGEIVVEATIDNEAVTFSGTHLLVATGRRGNTEDLGLTALGIETDRRGYLDVDADLRTNVPSIFGAGDVLGKHQFVYTAAYEGSLAAQNALDSASNEADYTALPWVVFTDPQVAGVGFDEAQAEAAGIDYEVSKLDLDQVPRSIAARDTRGFVKLLRDRSTDQVIGARILAPEGSELLMELSLAMKYGITVQNLATSFHPYLTLGEAVKLAAITFGKDIKKLSCCAA